MLAFVPNCPPGKYFSKTSRFVNKSEASIERMTYPPCANGIHSGGDRNNVFSNLTEASSAEQYFLDLICVRVLFVLR